MGPDDAVHPSDRRDPPAEESARLRRRAGIVLAAVGGSVTLVVLAAAGGAGALFFVVWLLVWTLPAGFGLYRWWIGRRFDPTADQSDVAPDAAWLAGARVDDDGLVLPGIPTRHTCDMTVGPDGVVLTAGWTSTTLPWGHHRAHPAPIAFDPTYRSANGGDGWWLTAWSSGNNGGTTGIAVAVVGDDAERTTRVRKLRSTWRTRLGRLGATGEAVPLVIGALLEPRLDAERGIIAVLCQVLAERPELRARLADRGRTERLLADLRRRPLPMVLDIDHASRRPFEVGSSLKRLGYTHALRGRPLPDEVLPPLNEVVSRVLADLRRNPFSRDLGIGEPQVRAIVRQRYLVEPWPFGALVNPASELPPPQR